MSQRQITFNAELINNEIVIRLTSNKNNRDLEIKAANQLFNFLEKIGIEVTRNNLETDWQSGSNS